MAETKNVLQPQNWIKDFGDDLFAYAMRKTSNTQLAEDWVQETFLAGLKSQNNFKGDSTEKTWLLAILKFKIADYYRKSSTKYELRSLQFNGVENSTNHFADDGDWKQESQPKDWGIDYSKAVENKELAHALNQCIDKLQENQKQLILLKLVEEQETEIVCKELNITATNYWVIIHRAKLQLRACLEKNWINT
ncbi:MAG: sigma-70 family RNA polymerase sigma factor [bacterium]|nr:sigma-70 family RNA polymerase sigma factor [bacterium]